MFLREKPPRRGVLFLAIPRVAVLSFLSPPAPPLPDRCVSLHCSSYLQHRTTEIEKHTESTTQSLQYRHTCNHTYMHALYITAFITLTYTYTQNMSVSIAFPCTRSLRSSRLSVPLHDLPGLQQGPFLCLSLCPHVRCPTPLSVSTLLK